MTDPRSKLIHRLQEEHYDLLVIGGGVTGAGIALDASLRGLKTALVEKGDFASGTSSKSTKLIHGGLRYLKQLELGIVAEVGRERAMLHRLAPHLVRPEKMLLPIYENGSFSRMSTSLGLWLYDLLAQVKGADRRIMLSADLTLQLEPLLRNGGLQASGLYAEYRTDDARLTIELVKTAARHGANCLNYVNADDFMVSDAGQLTGVAATDVESGLSFPIRAKAVVNAAGPWVDELRKLDHSLQNKRLFLSKGVHIVVPRERLPLRQSVYFDVADGRMIFAIPRHRATYIGTTDTPFTGDKESVRADAADVEYLLQAANLMFPDVGLRRADVESSWAGLRPLIYEEGKSASEMSRKDEVFVGASGLVSIAGGKLTGYRKMAEKVVNLLLRQLKRPKLPSRTDLTPLTEQACDEAGLTARFLHFVQAAPEDAAALQACQSLVQNYGAAFELILSEAQASQSPPFEAIVEAETRYCLRHELVRKPADFLVRRSGRLYFDMPSVKKHLDLVLRQFQSHFQWSDARLLDERAKAQALIISATNFQEN